MISKYNILILLIIVTVFSGCTQHATTLSEPPSPANISVQKTTAAKVVESEISSSIEAPIATPTVAQKYEYRNITKYKKVYAGKNYTYKTINITVYKGYYRSYRGCDEMVTDCDTTSRHIVYVCSYKIVDEIFEPHNEDEHTLVLEGMTYSPEENKNCDLLGRGISEIHRVYEWNFTPYEITYPRRVTVDVYIEKPYTETVLVPIG